MPKGATINAQYYLNPLTGPLREALIVKRPGKLHLQPLLQQDNARPHTASLSTLTIKKYHWKLLPYPPYSSDLAPGDCHLFGELKKTLAGIYFESLREMKRAVGTWVKTTPKKFFEDGLNNYQCVGGTSTL